MMKWNEKGCEQFIYLVYRGGGYKFSTTNLQLYYHIIKILNMHLEMLASVRNMPPSFSRKMYCF